MYALGAMQFAYTIKSVRNHSKVCSFAEEHLVSNDMKSDGLGCLWQWNSSKLLIQVSAHSSEL